MTNVIISVGFRRQAKQLRKKYPNIMRDLSALIAQLERGKHPEIACNVLTMLSTRFALQIAIRNAEKVAAIVSSTISAPVI
jgi:hypothetical protein